MLGSHVPPCLARKPSSNLANTGGEVGPQYLSFSPGTPTSLVPPCQHWEKTSGHVETGTDLGNEAVCLSATVIPATYGRQAMLAVGGLVSSGHNEPGRFQPLILGKNPSSGAGYCAWGCLPFPPRVLPGSTFLRSGGGCARDLLQLAVDFYSLSRKASAL